MMMGFTDRIKLRLWWQASAVTGSIFSSEEAAIRRMEPSVERIWMPRAGEPVIGRVNG